LLKNISLVSLTNFIIYFGSGIICLAFFVTLFYFNTPKPDYFKYIFWTIFFGLLISINGIFFLNGKFFPIFFLRMIQAGMVIIQSILLGFFFLQILSHSLFKKKLYYTLCICIVIQLLIFITGLINNADNFAFPTPIACLMLAVFSVFYYRDLLIGNKKLVILKSPVFMIVTGIFCWSCISFPIYALVHFVPLKSNYMIFLDRLFTISNIALIVMYLFFIKSYLCLKHPQNL
jgi:hypothetical protein